MAAVDRDTHPQHDFSAPQKKWADKLPIGINNTVRDYVISQGARQLMRAVDMHNVGDFERKLKEMMLANIGKTSKEPKIDGVIPQNLIIHGVFEAMSRAFMPAIETHGQDNLRKVREAKAKRRNILFVSNHRAHVDHLAIDFSMRRNGFTDVAETLTFIQGIKMTQVPSIGELTSNCLSRLNVWPPTVPVVSEEDKEAKDQMNRRGVETGYRAFDAGRSLLIYPEGERSKTGGLIKPKTMLGHWVRDPENTLIVPIALDRTEQVLAAYDFKIKAAVPSVTFCEPIEGVVLFGEGVQRSLAARESVAVHTVFTRIAEALPPSKRGFYYDKVA